MPSEIPCATGGEFLFDETDPAAVFTPADFDETQRMIAETVREFVEQSVLPRREALEFHKKVELGKTLLREVGEAGVFMPDISEAYGGIGTDEATVMLVSEVMAHRVASHAGCAGAADTPRAGPSRADARRPRWCRDCWSKKRNSGVTDR